MTIEEAKDFYPILQSYAEGKIIECRRKPSAMKDADTQNGWTEIKEIDFWKNTEYRIKPKSAYRPFENAHECLEEIGKHERFGWINYEGKSTWYCITAIINTNVYFTNFYFGEWRNFVYAFNNCTFTDGSPFGIKVEDNEDSHE